jgi:hypothetical protein
MAIPLAQGLELGIEGVWTRFDRESIDSELGTIQAAASRSKWIEGPSILAL